MRRFVLCVGLCVAACALSACGGGGSSGAGDTSGSAGGGSTVTSSNISLPSSVQVVSAH